MQRSKEMHNMNLRLIHLEQRIRDLEALADEVINLEERLSEQE